MTALATPWQVRYVRWWYERQVAWHLEMARRGRHREYNLRAAESDAATIPRIREHWLATGKVPDTWPVDQREAVARMRIPPRISMLENYDRWISPPPEPGFATLARRQRRTQWMFRRPRGRK